MDPNESKEKKIAAFDPNGVGDLNANIFGLPFNFEESDVVLLPVPWDVTVSYASGAAKGPDAIYDASFQVDLFDPDLPDAWKRGIYMLEVSEQWQQRSGRLRQKASEIIRYIEKGGDVESNSSLKKSREEINTASGELMQWVHEQTSQLLNRGKLVGLVGGDHSTPLGFIKALSGMHDEFGILQIDAHFDLREAYEGFTYSHASIMYNTLPVPQVKQIFSLGIRDYSQGEMDILQSSNGRIKTLTDRDIRFRQYNGESLQYIFSQAIEQMPQKIYISFDIDGLDPKLCPNTGTPVAGGFELSEIQFMLKLLIESGRQIIGFDLVEVAPGETDWNGNVGARVLYKLCNMMMKSSR